MHVCVCWCMYVYVDACMCMLIHVCVYWCMYVYIDACIPIVGRMFSPTSLLGLIHLSKVWNSSIPWSLNVYHYCRTCAQCRQCNDLTIQAVNVPHTGCLACGCLVDTNLNLSLGASPNESRYSAFEVFGANEDCSLVVPFVSFLVIKNATFGDGGNYTFNIRLGEVLTTKTFVVQEPGKSKTQKVSISCTSHFLWTSGVVCERLFWLHYFITNVWESMGKPCSCIQFIIKSRIFYCKSRENLYQVLQVTHAASERAMKLKIRMIKSLSP